MSRFQRSSDWICFDTPFLWVPALVGGGTPYFHWLHSVAEPFVEFLIEWCQYFVKFQFIDYLSGVRHHLGATHLFRYFVPARPVNHYGRPLDRLDEPALHWRSWVAVKCQYLGLASIEGTPWLSQSPLARFHCRVGSCWQACQESSLECRVSPYLECCFPLSVPRPTWASMKTVAKDSPRFERSYGSAQVWLGFLPDCPDT